MASYWDTHMENYGEGRRLEAEAEAGAENHYCCCLFSRSVVIDSLQPRELQHTRLPCPSPSPRVRSHSCPLSWWCHLSISSSVAPFSSCPHPSPNLGLFQWVSSLYQVAKTLDNQLCMLWILESRLGGGSPYPSFHRAGQWEPEKRMDVLKVTGLPGRIKSKPKVHDVLYKALSLFRVRKQLPRWSARTWPI